jgi:hypothetical protein
MPGAARGAQGPGSVRAACARDGHRRLTMRMGVHRAARAALADALRSGAWRSSEEAKKEVVDRMRLAAQFSGCAPTVVGQLGTLFEVDAEIASCFLSNDATPTTNLVYTHGEHGLASHWEACGSACAVRRASVAAQCPRSPCGQCVR